MSLQAQVNFFEDFESYQTGDLIAETSDDWTVWSGSSPNQDAGIVSSLAYEGENCLRVEGNDSDILLPFEEVYEEGIIEISMQVYVPSSRLFSFDLLRSQSANQSNAMQVVFGPSGLFQFAQNTGSSSGEEIRTTYPQNEWINVNVRANLSLDLWDLEFNGESMGTIDNGKVSLAGISFRQLNFGVLTAGYIDNVSYSWTAYDIPENGAALLNTNPEPFEVLGIQPNPIYKIRNVGTETLESVKITYTTNNQLQSETLEGLDIPFLGYHEFTPGVELNLESGENDFTIRAFYPNEAEENNNPYQQLSYTTIGLEAQAHKMILVEDLTGTWSSFSPRGIYNISKAAERYSDYMINVSVHGGSDDEPMMITEPLEGESVLTPSRKIEQVSEDYYPTIFVDRTDFGNPANINPLTLPKLEQPANARLDASATLVNRNLQIKVFSKALENGVSSDHQLSVILIENEVTGTGSLYSQANFYSESRLDMGEFNDLPDPVPASTMVYQNVARAYLGEFYGTEGSVSNAAEGEVQEFSFQYTVPEEFNIDNMKIIPVLFNPDGSVNNAFSISVNEAIDHEPTWNPLSVKENGNTSLAHAYPNPSQNQTNLRLQLPHTAQVQVYILDMMGRQVAYRDYGLLSMDQTLALPSGDLMSGQYLLRVQIGDEVQSQSIIVQ